MKQTKAPETTPTPQSHTPKPPTNSAKTPGTLFLTMALDMTWRLAIVVLVPVIGGFKLDEWLNSTPALTILGFLIAMAGMAYVMWQALQKANQATTREKEDK